MTNYSRSVLKSNGLPRPKIRLKKFGFSLKIVPANIAKKLPLQRCFKPLLIPIFNFSHKRRNVRFKGLRRVHTRLCSKNRTQQHTRRNTGLPSLGHSAALCCQRNFLYSTVLLYTYISRFSVNPQHQQKRIIRQSCRHKFYPQPLFIVFFNFSHKWPMFAFAGESGYTRHPSPEPRTQRLTRRNRWRFGWGCYYYPRTVSHGSETLRGRVLERCTLPFLGLGRVYARRTQRAFGTAMRLCASLFRRRRGPAGLRDLFAIW